MSEHKPMTDEQIDAIAGPGPDYWDRKVFARAIEAATAAPLLEQIAALEAELAGVKKGAERYRFIRDADRSDCITPELGLYAMETLDEYVDAAMEGEAHIADHLRTQGGDKCQN